MQEAIPDPSYDTSSFVPEQENDFPPPKKGKNKLLIGGLVLLSLFILAGAVGGAFYYKRITRIHQLQVLLAEVTEGSEDLSQWVSKEKKDFKRFPMTEEEEETLDDYWSRGNSLDPEDYESQIRYVQEIKELKETMTTKANADAAALLEELKNQDPGYASDQQKATLAGYASDMEELISKGQYSQLEPLAQEWKQFAESAAVKKTGYQVSIMQYDFTEYPTVRLYVDVKDDAGNSVKELMPNMFYLSQRQAGTGDFLARTIEKAVLMNENERLNINLLADTSGSMEGGNMSSAKSIMTNFINTVQFPAGDRVKLTPFNSIIDKSGFFTADVGLLNQTINNYIPTGQTKLYDAIIYGVQDVAGQEGAKCVIAFTDGMDVGSYNSAQDVLDVVSRYHIPVFIVRIGDSSNSSEDASLMQIAQASGGSFKNLSQFSSDMSDFYNQIYRQLKEYYVLEYTEDGTHGITQDKEFSIYVQNQNFGGETMGTANAGKDLFDSLLGSYLRSYITDMNNHYYNHLREYVDDTVAPDDKWSIQWQMQKQVSGGFSNVTAETLMDYFVTDIVVEDENTIRIKANERYDVIYDEVYGELQTSSRTMARDIITMLEQRYGYTYLSPNAQIRVWAMVNQIPEYILKKGADGKWKFSKYAGDLTLGEARQIYDLEIMSNPF
ncbi:MAG: VWA domain-containing protein [Lachnospiraceae bacterium]|nr:VWA domain-containing protein [Lachnospiraceae bacterium]